MLKRPLMYMAIAAMVALAVPDRAAAAVPVGDELAAVDVQVCECELTAPDVPMAFGREVALHVSGPTACAPTLLDAMAGALASPPILRVDGGHVLRGLRDPLLEVSDTATRIPIASVDLQRARARRPAPLHPLLEVMAIGPSHRTRDKPARTALV